MAKENAKTQKVQKPLLVAAIIAFALGAALFFVPAPDWKFWSLEYTLFLSTLAAVPIIALFKTTSKARALILIASLALFGFLQFACPRPPGAIELIAKNLLNDKPILQHVIKVSVWLALAVFFARYYCGFICPKGALQEFLFRPKLAIKVPAKLDKILKYGKYITLILLIAAPLFFDFRLFRAIAPFKALFNLDATWPLIIFFTLVIISSMFVERAYCRYFCHEGGLLAITAALSPFKLRVDEKSCNNCLVCSRVCPTDAIHPNSKTGKMAISASECILCMECRDSCKQNGIYFGLKMESTKPETGGNEK